ncbi:hypothetical protein DPMN_107782 [Dreissena polymorpha]|uniref:Uncharacterized protein n=1 Tax=Dreissena polymorpha TaxID=45954 RepID=A0A9D4K7I3_DREPO|nr:hypothetical protein DPMN_107782 [Dreissena polymorpha]
MDILFLRYWMLLICHLTGDFMFHVKVERIHSHEIEPLPEVLAGEVELLPGILRKSRAESTCSKLGVVQSVRE